METNTTGQNRIETEKKSSKTKKMSETGRQRQKEPYQPNAAGMRCNWGVCVRAWVCY